jgi:acyl-CoA thioesterase FadM
VRSDGVLCLEGRIVAAAIDANGASFPLPQEFRQGLLRACGEAG